jgi:uncharacterized membrane protein
MSPSTRRTVVLALGWALPVGLVLLTVLPAIALWSRLPEPVATHWNLRGHPNGAMPRVSAVGISLALACAGAALAALWTAVKPRTAGVGVALLAGGLFLSGLGASTSLVVILGNLDAATWRQAASLGWARLAIMLVIPYGLGAAGAVAGRLTEVSVPPPSPGAGARLGLSPTERAFWSAGARSRPAVPLTIAGLAAAAAGGAIALDGTAGPGLLIAAAMVVVAGAVLSVSSVWVTAGADGLTVRYGPLGWPVTRLPLRRILSAEAIRVRTVSWGYRGSLLLAGRAAVIVRNGPALRVHLKGNRRFLVTVDDAESGAALINDELARSAGPS